MKENNTVIYVNHEAINFELTALQNTLQAATAMQQYLSDNGYPADEFFIMAGLKGNFKVIASSQFKTENIQLANLSAQFGDMVAEDGKRKLDVKINDLANQIQNSAPRAEKYLNQYLECLIFGTEISINPEHNKAYFENKHTLSVDANEAKYQKQLVDALNYFIANSDQRTDPERMFKQVAQYNANTRTYEPNLEFFDSYSMAKRFVNDLVNN